MTDFCNRWGISQRISSAYNPSSNKRAEVAVKSAKRMVRDNLANDGSLDTDAFGRAILIHRNNPDPTTGLSPAQIIFGRQLRDHLPLTQGKFVPRQEWRQTAELREQSLASRHVLKAEQLARGSKALPPLHSGQHVAIQDQTGNTPRRWSKTGMILEALPHSSYLVKVNGSNRVTKRNRQFLRLITPFHLSNPSSPTSTPSPSLTSTPTASPSSTSSSPTPPPIGTPSPPTTSPTDGRRTRSTSQIESKSSSSPTSLSLPTPPSPSPSQHHVSTPPHNKASKPQHLRERWILRDDEKKKNEPVIVKFVKNPDGSG